MKHTHKLINFLLISELFLSIPAAYSGQGDSTRLLNPRITIGIIRQTGPAASPTAVAIFSVSNGRDIEITQRTSITGVVFQVNALYEITALLGEELFINGSVMNNLTFEQNFIAQNGGDEPGGSFSMAMPTCPRRSRGL